MIIVNQNDDLTINVLFEASDINGNITPFDLTDATVFLTVKKQDNFDDDDDLAVFKTETDTHISPTDGTTSLFISHSAWTTEINTFLEGRFKLIKKDVFEKTYDFIYDLQIVKNGIVQSQKPDIFRVVRDITKRIA